MAGSRGSAPGSPPRRSQLTPASEIALAEQAFALALKPGEAVGFLVPPKPLATTFGAVVKLKVIPNPGFIR